MRDPLLALGCQDPVERVSEAKERDGRRQAVADLFAIWWEKHQGTPVAIRQLHDDVKQALDPHKRGRQYLAAQLEKLAGTRMASFVLTRQASAGRWGAATYALKSTRGEDEHRDHRGHRTEEQPPDEADAPYASDASDAPMPPMLMAGTAKTNMQPNPPHLWARCPLCLRRAQPNRRQVPMTRRVGE